MLFKYSLVLCRFAGRPQAGSRRLQNCSVGIYVKYREPAAGLVAGHPTGVEGVCQRMGKLLTSNVKGKKMVFIFDEAQTSYLQGTPVFIADVTRMPMLPIALTCGAVFDECHFHPVSGHVMSLVMTYVPSC